MKFTIVWLPAAVNELLTVWMAAVDRHAVTRAADEIDAALKIDPVLRGETLFGPVRILIAEPLQAASRVFEEDRIVQILAIARQAPEEQS